MLPSVRALFAATALSLAACGNGSSAALGKGTDSGVQGVPVPNTAEEHEDLKGSWVVPDTATEEISSWYEDALPVGEHYEDLEFCETQEDEGLTSWLWWEEAPADHDGTPWLAVRIFDEDPTSIMLSYDDDDPSNCAAQEE